MRARARATAVRAASLPRVARGVPARRTARVCANCTIAFMPCSRAALTTSSTSASSSAFGSTCNPPPETCAACG
eukprot:397492-Prymnesium_polylepis.1